ncbi:peptidoglycan-associated lipoprotein Pal [Candidatus Magnetominusculus dajiuhuensis]|uniref:peptidoglycan-associated lipoprotein Pal n=1 Tax=Candidatus Magnetominusculus dajiuhuensis TaxID=3137712 RepID=UPI003B428866
MKRIALLLVLLALVVSGCATTDVAVPDDKKGKDAGIKERNGKDDVIKIDRDKIREGALSEEQIRSQMASLFKDIHFGYNRYDVADDEKANLRKIAEWLLKNSNVSVLIEGHCDERGSSEYNLALGDQRAQSTKNYLVSLGVPASRLETISFGKEKQVCMEHTEECWLKNRRAHFVSSK